MDKAIGRAAERVAYVSSDKEALRVYEMRQMALSDLTSGLNHARREGVKEGIEKGIAEGIKKGKREGLVEGLQKGKQEGLVEGLQKGKQERQKEISRNLKSFGVSVEQIAQATGLSKAEIARL